LSHTHNKVLLSQSSQHVTTPWSGVPISELKYLCVLSSVSSVFAESTIQSKPKLEITNTTKDFPLVKNLHWFNLHYLPRKKPCFKGWNWLRKSNIRSIYTPLTFLFIMNTF